jgi:hypothetical protein
MPVSALEFRRMALNHPDAVEGSHMHHPDFRVRGRVFATLGYPDAACGMVKLSPAKQAEFIGSLPEAFAPAAGAWGRRGATVVNLRKARKAVLQRALLAAWSAVARKTR